MHLVPPMNLPVDVRHPRSISAERITPSTGVDSDLYIHYGCGICAPEGWLNFDASPRLRLESVTGLRWLIAATTGTAFPPRARPGDVVQGLPVADGSARGVYCSHVLEHLPRDDVPTALRNTFRMLRPGGVFRLVVPDLQWRIVQYTCSAAREDPAAADRLIDACLLGMRTRRSGVMSWLADRFGKNAHLWMYDFAGLKDLLEQAGFAAIRRCQIGDCQDRMFGLVEDASRFFEAGERELAIETIRPLAHADL